MLQGMESGRETAAAPFLPFYHFCLHLPQRLGETDFHSVSIKNPSVDHDYPATSDSLFSNGMLGSGSFWGNFEIVD